MSLSVGIVGLPNVGKSTLFNALTQKGVEAANYPFCTIDPSVGVVAVPDERLDRLHEFSHSKKRIPAIVEFVDIAGLVKGAAEGAGLGNQFLANIRETDAIAEVVRIFDDKDIVHVSGQVDPKSDVEVIDLELILADLQVVKKWRESLSRDVRRGEKSALERDAVLRAVEEVLEGGERASTASLTAEEWAFINELGLLTKKPVIYVLNKKAGGRNLDETEDDRYVALIKHLRDKGERWVIVDAKIEDELGAFVGEEKQVMARELGVANDGVDDLIRAGYEILGRETFFTTGEDETRAWTIRRGSSAPEAGAAIHGDFQERFIRAEVIAWKDLLDAGGYAQARERGLLRIEGKEYIVQDGDVIEFKI
jgi:hypothetical protein